MESFFKGIYQQFKSLSLFSYDLLHLLMLVVILFILNEVIKALYSYYKNQIVVVYGNYGFISREYLMNFFTDKSFEKWCSNLCENMGLINVKKNHNFNPSYSNIKGLYHKKHIYISTIFFQNQYDYYDEIEDSYDNFNTLINKDTICSFVGNLISNNASTGMIFTNGYFSDECKSYVNSLSTVNLELIDGDRLISKYLEYISKENRKKLTKNSSTYIDE